MPKTVPTAGPTDGARVRRRSSTALTVISAPPRPRGAEPGLALEHVEPGQRIALRGRLDVAAAADARLALAEAVATGAGDLVLDLSELVQVDATGLGVLVGAHRAAGRAARRLVLCDVAPQVERLLFVTRLHRVIRTVRSDRTTSCA